MNKFDFEKYKDQICNKIILKQDIFSITKNVFSNFSIEAEKFSFDFSILVENIDKRIEVKYEKNKSNEFLLQVGGDLLFFCMHTNVFSFDTKNGIYKSKYVLENPNRAYCGMIEIYNFLNDSLKYERKEDLGELIARIFINNENHFFIEAEGQLGFKFNDFSNQIIDNSYIREIIELSLVKSIEYDLWVPPFNEVKYVPLGYILEKNINAPHITTKRLGFELSKNSNLSI